MPDDTPDDSRQPVETPDDDRRSLLQTIGGTAVAAATLPEAVVAGDRTDHEDRPRTGSDLVPITHGVASGDVTARTAAIWARAAETATVHVEFGPDSSFDRSRRERTAVDATTDFTGQIRLTELEPGTRYYYRVWATNVGADGEKERDAGSRDRGEDRSGESRTGGEAGGPGKRDRAGENSHDGRRRQRGTNPRGDDHPSKTPGPVPDDAPTGTFVTAPAPNEGGAVSFAWSGDTWGYGNDPIEPPYPGLETIADAQPDFFLYLGDTIYADAETPAGKITRDTELDDALEIYRGKYKEMRDPPADVAERTHLRTLLESTSVYSVWDDHEVINNFAGPIEPLMPFGRRAFREYWPLDRGGRERGHGRGRGRNRDDNRLYGSFQWGRHLELFVLDTRQYRDPNVERDEKTLLGEEQLQWFLSALSNSEATWKVVASPAPLGHPSDSWATPADRTGYESELLEVVTRIREDLSNVVVVAGDVHHSQVGAYDPDDDGEFEFYEAIAGPLGAPAGEPDDLYGPLNPTEFFAKGGYANYGTISVDESGERLTIGIYDEQGVEQFEKTIRAGEPTQPDATPERIESTFDGGDEGWLISQNGGSDRPTYRETGGDPGGHVTDDEAQGGVAWYYQAPFKFLGDREAFYGGTLSFDLRQEPTDQQFDAPPIEGGDVALSNGERTLVYEFRGSDSKPGDVWTSFEAPLTADAGWIDLASREPFATEAAVRSVLADLKRIRIRGEYRSGDDTSFLDNVVLERD